jgi:hypothetical protein
MNYFNNFMIMKIIFTAVLKQFDAKGEKTGWTYIEVPAKVAQQLKPGNKRSFRVKGTLDQFNIQGVALVPMGGGNFIMAINAGMRKGTGKRKGDRLEVQVEPDETVRRLSPQLMECLEDEPKALAAFKKMPGAHQQYYSNWIESAKTDATRIKRIALAVDTLAKNMNYGGMIRSQKKES